jgi:hypothetical protein
MLSLAERSELNLSIFDPASLKSALVQLREQAASFGLELAGPRLIDLFTEEVSLAIRNGTIFVAVHLPLKSHAPLSLFKYPAQSYPLNTSAVASLTQVSNFLALDKTLSAGLELSSAQLRTCKKRRHLYMCRNQGILRKQIETTCLGSLFLNVEKEITKACDFKLFQPTEPEIVQVGHSTLRIWSGKAETAEIRCNNEGKNMHIQLIGLKTIHVPSNCLFTTAHISFQSEFTPTLARRFKARPLRLAHLALLGRHSSSQYGAILDHLGGKEADLSHLQHLLDEADQEETPTNALVGVYVALTLLSLAVLAMMVRVALVYRRAKRRKPESRGGGKTEEEQTGQKE